MQEHKSTPFINKKEAETVGSVSEKSVNQSLFNKVKSILISLVSGVLTVKAEEIDSNVGLNEYGFDPVKFSKLVDAINEKYGLELDSSIFIQYQTIQSASRYLVNTYEEQLLSKITLETPDAPACMEEKHLTQSSRNLHMEEMNRLLCRLLWGQMQQMGLFDTKSIKVKNLKEEKGILSIYGRWLEETLEVLKREGYLIFDKDRYIVKDSGTIDLDGVWKTWYENKKLWAESDSVEGQMNLLEATISALPHILTGKIPATDIIFPDSSMKLVEGIYKGNRTADYFNDVLSDTVVSYIRERISSNGNARIRIIEIGAGTGSTSINVFNKIKPYEDYVEEYCYTDISKAFLLYAEKEFGSWNRNLTYRILNIEEPITGQDMEMGRYDIVIAANVLHATKNIRQTVRNAKALLKRNGLILLNELSSNTLFAHLTFGLLEGWWLYEDPLLRIPGCPALSPDAWQYILENEGFEDVTFPASSEHGLGQQIIAAISDGVIRKKHSGKVGTGSSEQPIKPEKVTERFTVQEGTDLCPEENIEDLLKEKSVEYFKKIVADTIKIQSHKIDPSEPLEKYGIDSIMVIKLTSALKEVLGDVDSTMFFEYQTLDAIVDYFIKTKKELLISLTGLGYQKNEAGKTENKVKTFSQPAPAILKSVSGRRHTKTSGLKTGERDTAEGYHVQDVAIIGLSGRYAQAENISELWNNLKEGRNCITEIPGDRWDWKKYFDGEKGKAGYSYTKWGGFISDIDKFDPLFFSMSPKEAENLDPQERLFLQVAYSCIEDAGYTPGTLSESNKVGVFVGVMNGNYPTGASYWSIANRVSYLFNFQGPSMAIDTACSSSLTAVHSALESIYSGISDCAIAGGVNLIVDPVHYLKLTSMTMLSPTNNCKAFGAEADGFVDGEGVGAIVLKPLSKAVNDGDHIYGVIKGSMINSGGKTNGYTVPNPNAQSRLISEALKRARVHPRTVSYIEAHGTGTALGDPIEIKGLTNAFQQETNDKAFCSIGSIKTNIGHCESAAGIAGITKILLQLKYSMLVPSLHSKVLNPNIQFERTPFFVQQRLEEWKRPVIELNGETREYPRIAAISSFGAGGANASVIIEEYMPSSSRMQEIPITSTNPAILVLSAKNEEQLRSKAKILLKAIRDGQYSDSQLADMAYTLQVGREPMEERLGILACSLKEFDEKLEGFIEDSNHTDGCFRGKVKNYKEIMSVFTSDDEMKEALEKWIRRKKYTKLVELWVKGVNIDWNKLYDTVKPQRISLPSYPFAKNRYWKEKSDIVYKNDTDVSSVNRVLHPLLHCNTSDIYELRYSSTFKGDELLFAHHKVGGQKILPAAAYLEMARAAVELAAYPLTQRNKGIKMTNVLWVRPFVLENDAEEFQACTGQIHLSLIPVEGQEIDFEVYSQCEEPEAETVVHSQGHIKTFGFSETPMLDYKQMRDNCSVKTITSRECYEFFRAAGLDYGPSHRGIQEIYVGREQVLAKLSLPLSMFDTYRNLTLHPGILDSALQASAFLAADLDGSSRPDKLLLPFMVGEISIYGKCTREMWAFVRYSSTDTIKGKPRNIDIDLCDEYGNLCVEIKGFSVRETQWAAVRKVKPLNMGTVVLQPHWQEQAVSDKGKTEYRKHVVMLCEQNVITVSDIEGYFKDCRAIQLNLQYGSVEERYQDYAISIFEEIQSILRDKLTGKTLLQVVVPGESHNRLFSGLTGILRTAGLENPKLTAQLIETAPGMDSEEIIEIISENMSCPEDLHICYRDGKRLVPGWSEVNAESTAAVPWKDGGVYLITGGAGGLGLIFAAEIAENVKKPVIILAGRSKAGREKEAGLKKLQLTGAEVHYEQVDVTQRDDVNQLIYRIVDKYGKLDGIIHSAGIVRDNYIIKKTKSEFKEVMAPKVTGLWNLDQASKDISLDFFIIFSSGTGVFGNPGQADYAAANAFMDVYAGYRNRLVESGQRKGRTLSINWPLWEEGGMYVGEEARRVMKQSLGMIPMKKSNGIQALYQGLQSGKSQIMVIEGEKERIYEVFLRKENNRGTVGEEGLTLQKPKISEELIKDRTMNYFKKLLSGEIKLPVNQIEADAPMEKYGIDSVMVMKMTSKLEKTFGPLPKTLFFEYGNIQELTGYFLKLHRDKVMALLGVEEDTKESEPLSGNKAGQIAPMKPNTGTFRRFGFNKEKTRAGTVKLTGEDDIAVIGVAGRYPGASNIYEYWKNLKEGKDLITEIPKDRWDYDLFSGQYENSHGKPLSKWGGFLDGVDRFDPLFFNISPREAQLMDPQERLFLECVYETLQDAGYSRERLSRYCGLGLEGNVGVYVGVMYEEYQLYGAQLSMMGTPVALAGNPSSIANRVSYFFNFHGPSMAVDTMCSSSLTAIHLACRSLQKGECEIAVAGGVNVSVHPNKYQILAQGNFSSGKGRCASFGKGGDGYVPGEGVGAVLLKPLSKAVADKDHIYGIIKATAINHGGKTNGYTVPNPGAQTNVIGRALKEAGIDARTVSYIEAHGTGTSLGDPIEIAGLTKAFREYTEDNQFCSIGSVKSNIGHCESAAGIAALTKVLLQLKYGKLVPSLHSNELNPNIDFADTPFVVQQKYEEWKRPLIETEGKVKEYPRRAGISAFGAGGSNAHIILEEYIQDKALTVPAGKCSGPASVILLSAKSEERLKVMVQRLLDTIRVENLYDNQEEIAYTLQVGREHMEVRLAVLADSVDQLENKLTGYLEGREDTEDLYLGQIKQNKDTLSVLTTDEDMRNLIKTWIENGKYAKLAELWSKGFNFDWSSVYQNTAVRSISLPTYPFQRERCWLPTDVQFHKGTVQEDMMISLSNNPETREKCFLEKQWVPSAVSHDKSLKPGALILATQDTRGLAEKLCELLPGSRVLPVSEPEALSIRDEEWKNYSGCIDLTGCSDETDGSYSWISWVQKFIEKGSGSELKMLCVTKGLERFKNTEINLSGALKAALYKMLQSEYSHLDSCHMDIEPSIDESQTVQQIITEYLTKTDESEICYRSGERFCSRLTEVKNHRNGGEKPEFPEGHVLWITGGTRGIGYLCAKHFVQKYGVKRLVLSGREEIPSREQWPYLMEQLTPMAEKIRAITELESLGVQVKVISVPLSDEETVKRTIQDINDTMGPVGGLIHSAGTVDRENPAFIRKSQESIMRVLEPKTTGVEVLYECLKGQPLKFFVLFSSVSASVPLLASGQSDYSMANAYLSYFANAHWKGAYPVISIEWPNWSESGLGEVKSRVYRQTGLLSITNREGLQMLDEILYSGAGPVVIPAVVNPLIWNASGLTLNKKTGQNQGSRHIQKPADTECFKTENDLVKTTINWMVAKLSEELRIDPSRIDTDTPFSDYGVDSIMLTQLIRHINQLVGQEIDPSVLYEYQTARTFSAWLVSRYEAALAVAFGQSVEEEKDTNSNISVYAEKIPSQIEQLSLPDCPKEVRTGSSREIQDIAVVGLSCRFPGAENIQQYWNMLSEGRCAIRNIPEERWGYKNGYYAGLLDNTTHFDPKFFHIPDVDARAMDPQSFLLLEAALELFSHAGYTLNEMKGRQVGVYIGGRSGHKPDEASILNARNPIVAIGQNYLAANISQFYDLRGPSLVLDTACSSALVGMNMAIQALRSKEIQGAIVGGISLLGTDEAHKIFERRGILSREPFFHVFDQRAQGVVLGEGVGMVLLKTLDQAMEDGDKIYAVIKGLSVNNDGRTAGPATPNISAQKEVMQAALDRSGIGPGDVTYIEVNGSGSEVTDLLELKSIEAVYRLSGELPLGLGCVKPNIGHPLCAEGIAALIKVVLMLYHGKIVPFVSGEMPMKHYNMKDSPFCFYRKAEPWPVQRRIAGINCFADGGTNAHVIVEHWEDREPAQVKRKPIPVPQLKRYHIYKDEGKTQREPMASLNSGDFQGDKGKEEKSHQGRNNSVISIWKQKIVEGPM
jgi:polyketide synthase PksN